jgi:hypothetical protein
MASVFSEIKAQSELSRTTATQSLRKCGIEYAESCRVANVERRRCEVGVIEGICKRRLKSQVQTLSQGKLLGEARVDVDFSRALQDADAASAKPPGIHGGKSKGAGRKVVLRRPAGGGGIAHAVGTRNGPS